jgi:hypothetical protein
MARVRSGQAPAWPLVLTGVSAVGSRVKGDFAYVDRRLSACAGCPAGTVMLGAGGAGTYAQQAIPRTLVSPGCALSWSSVAGLFGCSSCSAPPGVHSRRVIRVWGGASHGRVMVASRMTEDYVRSVARLAYLWAPFSLSTPARKTCNAARPHSPRFTRSSRTVVDADEAAG